MKTYFWRICFLAFIIIIIMAPGHLNAACEIVGHTINGYIVVCDGPDTIGVTSGNGNDIITIETGAEVTKVDLQSSDSTANANATTIDAGSGNNQVINHGRVAATAYADALPVNGLASRAAANATGISAGEGADDIQSGSTIDSIAISYSRSGDISITLDGNTQFQGTTTSTATATGVNAGRGNNQVIDTGAITTMATSVAEASSINVDVGDSGAADVRTIANAIAAGISGGNGKDEMTTRGGTITVSTAADANNVNALVTIDVAKESLVAGSLVSDASVTAEAVVTGITGGAGDDTIVNDETEISADANGDATAVGVSLTISGRLEGNSQGKALSDSSATAVARATGIDGGGGNDAIENRGNIFANADSTATSVGVGVDITLSKEGSASGAALSNASVTANATATGIDGGEGKDEIDNRGDVNLTTDATSTGVSVALDVAGTMKGKAAGSSVSDASVTAKSTAIGLTGGEGDDTVINDGLTTTTTATSSATGVSVALTVSGSMKGNVEGKALSDASITANAAATGIDAGSGQDTIDNWSKLSSQVDASATGVAASLKVGFTKEGDAAPEATAEGAALSNSRVTANASAMGIDGGNDKDEIDNRGAIDLLANSSATGVSVALDVAGSMKGDAKGSSVSDSSVTAKSTAIGITGGEGDDTIANEGAITLMSTEGDASATGVSVGLTVSGSLEGNAEGKALSDSSALADATATGISGGAGVDAITNRGAIAANVDSTATAVGVSVDVALSKEGNATGAALSNASVTANAAATGIDGGEDNDAINNRGDIDLLATSGATGVSVALDVAGTMKGSAAGSSVSNSSVTAEASAIGIEGGASNDTIINDGLATITNANASGTGVSVGLTVSGSMEGNVAGKALSDASVTANAAATGINGGSGQDTIDNWSKLSSQVDASATGVAASLKVGFTKEGDVVPEATAEGATLSNSRVTANAAAMGIDGGEDNDAINNRGDIDLLANSTATGVSVALDVAGTMKGSASGSSVSDSSVTAKSTATGIDGGDGDDTITNEGSITLMKQAEGIDPTDASATAVSVGLTISGSLEGNAEGKALSNSSARADATAIGIDGGLGIDTITNRGAIAANVDSSATAVGVGLDVNIIVAKEGDIEGNVSGAALSDASVTADASAIGIDAGGDKDTIDNRGGISLSANSNATGVAVSLAVAGSVASKGNLKGEIEGKALSNATTTARAEATGIDGGEDGDQIINTGDFISLQAQSNSAGVSASVNISAGVAADGNAKVNATGGAVSDARVTAEASVSAIRGGGGDDEVINAGDFVNIGSVAKTTSVAASLEISGALAFKGDADASTSGSAASVSSADALTRTVAIDGGTGNDIISNTGNIINLESDSTATSVSAGANVSTVVAIKGNADADVTGEAVGDSRVTAQAAALGIDGGLGDDTIDNEGDMRLLSTADATGVAAELNVSAALSFKGVSTADVSGTAASNSSVLAKAEATGIDGEWGQDTIQNSGDITLMNEDVVDANALGVSASLNISGNVAIKGAAAGTVEGVAASNATVTAEAAATGIDGGGDNDIIDNTGAIKLLPSSNAVGVAASLNVSGNMAGETGGSAMSDASVIATSTAAGINAGEGNDTIVNEGTITLMKQEAGENEVDAKALGVAASLNVTGNLHGTEEGQALSKATTTADASATGIRGGSGLDDITNRNRILADVDADALGVAATLGVTIGLNGEAVGAALSDSGVTAKATARGIDGGEGADTIANQGGSGSTSAGDIELHATSDAESVAVSVNITGSMRGSSEGKTVADASAAANSIATGIDGGSGQDDITNMANIYASVDSHSKAVGVSAGITVTLQGTAEGAALSDVSAESFSSAIGIDGAADNDRIENQGSLDLYSFSDSQTTAVSVSLTGTMGGVAEGKSVSNGSAKATSRSTGIAGGEGDDIITNSINKITTFSSAITDTTSVSVTGGGSVGLAKNAAVANASSISEAYSTGIDGGLGNDTIENASEIKSTAKADAEASSTTVGVTIGIGAAEIIGTGDSSATARTNSTGIEGGEGNDRITNTAKITTGGLEAMGPMANAQAGATTVTVGIAVGMSEGEASSNGAALAEANAAGISSGSGDDWIHNTGDITVGPDPQGTGNMASASAESTTVDVSVTLGASLGKSSSNTSSTAVANLAGISAGSGNDTVYNSGTITVGTHPYEPGKTVAMATATAGSETVNVGLTVGGSFSDASSNSSATAHSNATGIETGLGADVVNNTGALNILSSSAALSTAEAEKVALTIGALEGAVKSNASTLSTARATGIDSGEGADEIDARSDFVVKAFSMSATASKAEDLNILSIGSAVQAATANSSSTAEASARGIHGGTGADTITAAGNYEVSADTLVSSTSRSSTVTGVGIGSNVQEAKSRAGTASDALAIGIDGGEGNDVINSSAALTVKTFSNASTTGVSATNTGFNIAGSSSGESVAGATSNVTATGIGIRSGTSVLAANESDADVIVSEGIISVTSTVSAKTQSTSTADSITFIGAAEGTAISDASAKILADGIGIDGGADNDTITSKNTITVKTKADGSVTSTSNVDSYATFGGASSMGVSDASANVLAEATGISGGTGDDIITSLALIEVEAESVGSVSATSDIDAVVTFGGASSKAASDASVTKKGIARGIDGGDGDDVITNYDTLKVTAISDGTVTSNSYAGAKATFGSTSSMTTTAAALEGSVDAAGIIGGSGDDWIKNLGRVDSIADATLQVNNSSMASAKSTFGSSNARAFSVSTLQGKASSLGVSGDGGDDLIENDGIVDVSAIANTTVNSFTVAIAKSFWGNEYTEAASSNYAAGESTAEGITAGAGEDKIVNKGLVIVEAGGEVKVNSLTVSSDGPAYSDAGTLALAYAKGIDGGVGDDGILNTDTVFVKAKPSISSATRTFGGNVDGKVGVLLNGAATGITGGEGNDAITNEGNVLAFAGIQEKGSTVSESAVSGSTTIKDQSFSPVDPQGLVGKWIRITGGENPDFFTRVVAFDPQTKTFTLHDPLKYDLPKDAAYLVYDYGDKTADITSVNLTVGGRTRVDASTTASVQAIGIEGNDQSSVTDASDAGVNVFTDLSRKGEDPEAIVGKLVFFKSGSSADFATLVTAFNPDTGTFTLADPLPSGGLSKGDIYTLGGGSDRIANLGAIDVKADSAINASSWSLSFGSADIDGKGWAQAFSAGVRGGAFNDSFQNYGGISARSTAGVSSTDRVYVAFGSADQKISFEASSHSVGVDAGGGDDEFINAENSSINAEAASKADVHGVTTTFLAEVKNSVNAIADSTALGLDLGQGNNVAHNEGEFRVSANAITNAQAISDTVQILGIVFNETDADADAIAKASAWGIRAGSGEDQIFNRALIQVNASAEATSFAKGSKVGSDDDTSTVTKNSDEGSKTFVDASLIPAQGQDLPDLVGKWVRFLTGENKDFFTRIVGFDSSTGTITLLDELPGDLKAAVLDDKGNVVTPADLYTFSAARNGTSASVASALATGIDVGNGNAVVENTGVIRVKAYAKANTTAQTFGGQATAQANSSAEARGIRTGTGDDVIRNAGVIDVVSEVVTTTSGASPTEIAIATGMDAGDGNNKIANEGEINVTASVDRPDGEVKATGITTGAGDDTLINEGTISATMIRDGVSSPGVAITTGAGNDHVFLMNSSTTTGSIDLGDGDDGLTFAGAPLVTGDITGSAGIDTLVFDGAGTVGFTPRAFENAIKQGAGTYSVVSLPTMQRIEIKKGVLEVNDTYQFSNNGSFETFVKGDGSFGQLKVNGTTGLAGDLSVLKGPGYFKNGATYPIIEATEGPGVTGAFDNILLPATKPLLRFDVHQLPNAVEVEVHSRRFTTVATNRVERAVANYLDRVMPTAAGDLSNVLGEVQSSSLSQLGTAFSSLSSDSYDNYTRTTHESMWQYTGSLQRRLNNIRAYGIAEGYDPESKPLLLAFSGSDASLGQLLSPDQISQTQAKNGLWFNGYGQWGDQESDKGFTGFDYNLYGGTLGFDHTFGDKLIAGLSVGYSRAEVGLDHHQGDGSIKTFTGSLYGSYFTKSAYVEGAASYGRNWYDNHRLLTVGATPRRASSDHEGDLFSGYLGAGYTFDVKKWLIGPFGTLRYVYLDEESFEERGAGAVGLRIDDRQTDALVSELGIRLARIFKTKCGSLIPETSAAWLHDFDIDDRVITSSFAGSPGASFSIEGQDVDRNGATLGAAITFVHKSGLSTSLKYRGEFREKYKSNGIMGELRFMF